MNDAKNERFDSKSSFGILGFKSALMRDILKKAETLAALNANTIIMGELGSGKQWLARRMHERSSRSEGPFHVFYCVDVDEENCKDAFMGQIQFENEYVTLKYDVLEKASGGTLFLNQFSELPLSFMINIIDSFNKGCEQLFRYDIASRPRLILSMNLESYSRLAVTPMWEKLLERTNPVSIMVPPLRDHKEDIPILIDLFLDDIKRQRIAWREVSMSIEARNECLNYYWPGNVRQLKNAILQGAVLSYGKVIENQHLPFSMSWKLPYRFSNE